MTVADLGISNARITRSRSPKATPVKSKELESILSLSPAKALTGRKGKRSQKSAPASPPLSATASSGSAQAAPVTRSRAKATPAKGKELDSNVLLSSTTAPPSTRKGKRSQKSVASQEPTEPPSSPKSPTTLAPSSPLQSVRPWQEAEPEEFGEGDDLEALAAAISDNLQARLRLASGSETKPDDDIRTIFENTKIKRPESYGAFVLEGGVVQLGALPEGRDNRNVIASIANNNRVTSSVEVANPKIYAMPTTRVVTTGPAWFNMKSPEMTPELKTDLAIIANRAYLDPKRFYKKEGTKKLATHFQIGTVVSGAHEFYSALTHKERSRNYVEEIYKDTSTKSYLKRKYGQIQATKSMKGHTKKYRGKKRGK